MTPQEKGKLQDIIKEVKEKEEKAFDNMRFLREHKFPFEETATRLQMKRITKRGLYWKCLEIMCYETTGKSTRDCR